MDERVRERLQRIGSTEERGGVGFCFEVKESVNGGT